MTALTNMQRRQRKAFAGPLEFKLSDTLGAFRATFSLFNSIDLDKDVTLPGAFKVGTPVRIAQWGHNWDAPAIGTGILGADGERAWVDGQFNLAMQVGKDTYEAVKALSEAGLQQWSYGYDVLASKPGTFEGTPVRFLTELEVHEISPVMLGAQPLTSTDTIKSASGETKSLQGTFEERMETVSRAAYDAFGGAEEHWVYVYGTYSDHAIIGVEADGQMAFSDVPYTIDGDGVVAFGDGRAVELQTVVTPKAAKEGRRNSAADIAALQKAHDHVASVLGLECAPADGDEKDTTGEAGANADGKASKGDSPKAQAAPAGVFAQRVALELLEMGES